MARRPTAKPARPPAARKVPAKTPAVTADVAAAAPPTSLVDARDASSTPNAPAVADAPVGTTAPATHAPRDEEGEGGAPLPGAALVPSAEAESASGASPVPDLAPEEAEPRDWPVVSAIRRNGVRYRPGDVIALTDTEAATLPRGVLGDA